MDYINFVERHFKQTLEVVWLFKLNQNFAPTLIQMFV
jgi:hypothetical protein